VGSRRLHPQQDVLQSRVILAGAQGQSDKAIGAALKVHRETAACGVSVGRSAL